MFAILPESHGGPEVMVLREHATPAPGAGQLLVRVEAAGVNFIDIYQRSGQYKTPLPIPLGLEGAGVVEAVGDGVTGVSKGDRVAWSRAPGSYSTHVLVPAAAAVPVPEGMSAATAAAAMLQGMTAHYLACSTYPLGPGDVCLIHAAAGGVGQLLCQMAKRRGAEVIATVSTEEKAAIAKKAGADHVVLYTQQNFQEEARRITGGEGVHVVYDAVGKDTFERSLDSLRLRGMMVLYGQASGAVPPIDLQLLNHKGSLFVTRPALHHYTASREELLARSGEVLGWIASGDLSIAIGATFPLAEAAEAHRALGERRTTGKVLLTP